MDWKTENPINLIKGRGWVGAWEERFAEHFGKPVKIEALSCPGQHYINLSFKLQTMVPFNTHECIRIKVGDGNEVPVYAFNIHSLPGLCGTMVFEHLKSANFGLAERKQNTCLLLLEFIKQLATFRKYTNIICSNVVPVNDTELDYNAEFSREKSPDGACWRYFKFKQNLLRSGFTVLNSYQNERSGNLINIFNINL